MNLKFLISLAITLTLIWALNKSWEVGSIRIPPLGKFLDPAHGFWQNIEPKGFRLPESLNIPGLQQPVTVAFDSIMIPHIFAQNDADLYVAQGYVTAFHRLWQMEFQTHAAAGRLAEILGSGPEDAILNYDRNQRRLGMVYAAENAYRGMEKDPVAKMVAEKYAEGINAYIQSLSYKDLPLEYKILDYKPEEWTMLKSALLLRSMAQTLNSGDKDIQMTNALKLFGKEMLEVLYPDREPMGDPIVDKPGGWNFEPANLNDSVHALPDELIAISGLTTPEPNIGSNNWAVSGSKTQSGYPILCNDPHLSITLPSIWYAIQLNAPGINTMGVSLPGAPGIIIGFNDSIAWGVTNAQRDLVDWYRITFENNKKEKYLLDGEWKDTRKVVEEFTIRGGEVLFDTVVYTHWGPVPYDEHFRAENERKHYAFRWIAHDESEELLTFYKLNRAKNHSDYMSALDHFSSPAQNFVFASVTGDIAMRIQGKFPARKKYEGKFVLDGSRSTQGPIGYIPFEHNVMDKNPERGFVSSANQYPADSTYPYYINAVSYEGHRNRRINNVLREKNNLTVKDMMNLQLDNYSIKAEEILPTLLQAVDETTLSPEEKEAYNSLKVWDYYYHKDAQAPPYFEGWWRNLVVSIWDEIRNDSVSLSYPTSWNTSYLIRTQPDLPFYDVQSTPEKETITDLIRQAFKKSMEEVEAWKKENTKPLRWADYKDTYVEHLTRQAPFSFHVEHGGHGDAVNASSRKHGPSWRMIVSVEPDGPKAFATYPGGQSGNPGSVHYNSMLDRWANGTYFRMLFLRQADQSADRILFSTTLNPK
ncbi:MAG: penicillin acylase family protein [Cyclobacteriaceae bacterium]|nr:MAG: penicillin acylase family protein [Cyclobacteriaceae bacterium]